MCRPLITLVTRSPLTSTAAQRQEKPQETAADAYAVTRSVADDGSALETFRQSYWKRGLLYRSWFGNTLLGHSGIPRNKAVDSLAKAAVSCTQLPVLPFIPKLLYAAFERFDF